MSECLQNSGKGIRVPSVRNYHLSLTSASTSPTPVVLKQEQNHLWVTFWKSMQPRGQKPIIAFVFSTGIDKWKRDLSVDISIQWGVTFTGLSKYSPKAKVVGQFFQKQNGAFSISIHSKIDQILSQIRNEGGSNSRKIDPLRFYSIQTQLTSLQSVLKTGLKETWKMVQWSLEVPWNVIDPIQMSSSHNFTPRVSHRKLYATYLKNGKENDMVRILTIIL